MTLYVMDACALTAYVRREQGAAAVDSLFADPDAAFLVHAVNLCEVYYDTLRDADPDDPLSSHAQEIARQTLDSISVQHVELRVDMEPAFWQLVGSLKVNPGKLSLADCFALALAITTGATLVTSDHHEFDAVVSLGLCPILFIR